MASNTKLLIAIDGPAASGKGTLAKRIAEHYGLSYLDSGAIYRAVGYSVIQSGGNPEDKNTAITAARSIGMADIKNINLYNEGVGKAASQVAAIGEVRDVLFGFQRSFIESSNGAVIDGRDIATVICPEAEFKFYITAQIEARAQRRYKQLQNEGKSIISYDSVLKDLTRRDERDKGRKFAPLRKAHDAIHIDTTNMGISEVFERCLSVIGGVRPSEVVNS